MNRLKYRFKLTKYLFAGARRINYFPRCAHRKIVQLPYRPAVEDHKYRLNVRKKLTVKRRKKNNNKKQSSRSARYTETFSECRFRYLF